MEQQLKRRKIKNYLIMKNVQFKFALTNLAYMLLIFVVFLLAVISPFYTDIFQVDEICDQYFTAKLFLVLIERLSIAMGILLLLAFVHQILMTHKFCGPLVNFAKTFARISQGDLSRKIYLRRYDFLQNEADQINAMMDGVSDLVTEIKRENDLVLSTLEEIAGAKGKDGSPTDNLTKLKIHADLCRRHIAKFKLAEPPDAGQHG